MNKFHKLLMGTTAIVSMFGWNVNVAQAQPLPAYCTGSAIGALLGLAITGNAKAASSAIPAECNQNQNSPSSQYQEPNPTNTIPKLSNTDLNPNRSWLGDSMRDTDRFIGGSGWRSIENNPGGWDSGGWRR
ncbi:hypothetical protein PN471_17310 [Aphanizomenon sp. CS-733/32]|uniref:hypothetical protein n=1 Tax=Aphanizomenon sp. CS-733/32 TaxID=3021715 RepID=UPI0023305781|nr:hypothetical protein [Aphanizomenon sp. CS-733/32]MDB9310357.1 hypothetical protein [Aphanizomenon sp. CS-733/32]